MIKLQEKTPNQKFRQKIEELLGVLFNEACEEQISSLFRSKQPFLYADCKDDELNEPHEWRCLSIMEAICEIAENHGQLEDAPEMIEFLLESADPKNLQSD